MIERPTLIVMAKAPRLGLGKSRLAKQIGSVEAWRINRALQKLTLHEAIDPRWRTVLCVTPDNAVALDLPNLWPRHVRRAAQGAGDLGERLARAMRWKRRVAVIGVDCPVISRAHIASAFSALKRAPFAIGPAEDGGFWLLAARDGASVARALAHVRWSSRYAAADVIRNLAPRRVARLATLWDVDVAADLKRAQRPALRVSSGV